MGVSRPENVDRADQIGVFLETAFDAQKPGLRLAVVRRHMAAGRARPRRVLRRRADFHRAPVHRAAADATLTAQRTPTASPLSFPGLKAEACRAPGQSGEPCGSSRADRPSRFKGYLMLMTKVYDSLPQATHACGNNLSPAKRLSIVSRSRTTWLRFPSTMISA